MSESSTSDTNAAELGRLVLTYLQDGQVDQMADLFHEDGDWHLAYALDGWTEADTVIRGRDNIRDMHSRLASDIGQLELYDIVGYESSRDLAFFELRSKITTPGGDVIYENRYVEKVSSCDGRIVSWLEYFDPRPAETLSARITGGPPVTAAP